MKSYNRITRSLQQTQTQLTELHRRNVDKSAKHMQRIGLAYRVFAAIINKLKDWLARLEKSLRSKAQDLSFEASQALRTARKIEDLLS